MRKVFWNKLAQADYHQIIDYLLDEWGKTQAQIFIDQVAQIEWILKREM
ncbi:plasmid stabilization system protein ParE [Roseimarinus sediminis]